MWNRDDFWGYVSREVLQRPLRIQTYVKDATSHQNVVNTDLPPRLSLRRFGSHVAVVWISVGYIVLRLFSYSGIFYLLILIIMWSLFVISKASLKYLKIMRE